jgi:hypothetical protein
MVGIPGCARTCRGRHGMLQPLPEHDWMRQGNAEKNAGYSESAGICLDTVR